LVVEPVPDALALVSVEPLAPMLVPEVLPVPDDDAVLPEVEPLVLAPALAEPPAGVPVAPIGVFCELRWPAPTAGSLAAGFGGVLWARAAPASVRAAAVARMFFRAVMECFSCGYVVAESPAPQG
jgi:hypothetical protein